MTVELTSPVLGKAVGYIYSGTLEDWLLAEGYAKRAGYTGPGVSNTGATDVVPAKDPGLASNRGDKAHYSAQEAAAGHNATIANDATNLTKTSFTNPDKFDFDEGGVDEDATTPAADGDTSGDGVAD
jgi:hypothetical protein